MDGARGRQGWLLGALALAIAGGLGASLLRTAPRFSDPAAPRAWAQDRFADLRTGRPPARPDLSTAPPPARPVRVSTDRVELEVPRALRPSTSPERSMLREAAGPDLRHVLPGPGPAVEVHLVAFAHRPVGGADTGPWLDPRTGGAVDRELAQALGAPLVGSAREPGFVFAVRIDGDPARPHGATLFERRTGVELSASSSWVRRGAHVLYSIDATVAHRASLSLCVPIAYGAPATASLEPAVGATVELGGAARLEVVHAGRGLTGSWGESDDDMYVAWTPAGTAPEPRFVAFSYWPPDAAPYLEYRSTRSGRWFGLFGPPGLAAAEADESGAPLELRCYPRGAVVHFDLPPLDGLPDLDNLFDARLPRLRAEDRWSLERQLRNLTLAEPGSLPFLRLPDTAFPFEREEVTVGALVDELATLVGAPLGFDARRGAFTARRPTVGRQWLESLFGAR